MRSGRPNLGRCVLTSDVSQEYRSRSTLRYIRGLFVLACAAAVCASCGGNPASSTPPPPPNPDPPKITCPSAVSVTSPTGQATAVSYGTATVVLGKSPVSTACTPASGAIFPIGTTTVTCVATDALQRTDSCTFGVTVAAPPRISLTRFVSFGDSITWGEDGQNSPTSLSIGPIRPAVQVPINQTYPGALQILLTARYSSQAPSVANLGCRGEAAGDLSSPCSAGNAVSRFSDTVGTGAYQAVLLMEGANDVAEQLALGGSTAPVDAAIAALRSMIDFAKSRNVRPYLATITPENPLGTIPARRGGAANFVPPFNDRLRSLASAEGITLVDVYAAFNGDVTTLIGSDGLHPTVAGYAVIANTFFARVKETLETATSPTFTFSAPFSAPARTGLSATPAAGRPGSRPGAQRPR